MSTFIDNSYRRYLMPRRLIFFDLDGTIIPSTHPSGRRTAICADCMANYQLAMDTPVQVIVKCKDAVSLCIMPAVIDSVNPGNSTTKTLHIIHKIAVAIALAMPNIIGLSSISWLQMHIETRNIYLLSLLTVLI